MKNDQEVILLTGATGFIGSALVHRFASRYTIVGLDRPGPPDPPAPAVAVDFDLSSDQGVGAALQKVREQFGSRLACVIHLAAYYDVSGEANPLYEQVTVQDPTAPNTTGGSADPSDPSNIDTSALPSPAELQVMRALVFNTPGAPGHPR